MSETKFTPGPWEAVDHYSDELSVVDSRGFEIAEAPATAILLDYSDKLGIKHWAHSPDASLDLSADEQAANARLIAAAPELLAALEAVMPFIDDASDVQNVFPDSACSTACRDAVIAAKTALQKARGAR